MKLNVRPGNLLLMAVSLWTAWNGVTEFDNAHGWVSFLRGFFWLTVGIIVFSGAWDNMKKVR